MGGKGSDSGRLRRLARYAVLLATIGGGLAGCAAKGLLARASSPGSILVEPRTGMELVLVRGGHLDASEVYDAGQGASARLPSAEIPDFYLGRFEVSQSQWKAVMETNPSRVFGDQRPVEQVSWDDATEFARRFSALSGRPFRLPSEAEWEWAFRQGHKTTEANRAAGADLLAAYAGDSQRPIRDVGSNGPDALGLFDLDGSLTEWCADRYSPRPTDVGSPEEEDDGFRVLRGAAGEDVAGGAAYRMGFHRSWVGRTVGFRVLLPATSVLTGRR